MSDPAQPNPSAPSADPSVGEFVPSVSFEEFAKTLDDFDPIEDLPSVWEGADKLAPSSNFTVELTAFAPETRKQLQERGRELNPADPEAGTKTAIGEHIRREAINARCRSMPESATFYQKEVAAQQMELFRNQQRSEQILQEMAKQRTVIDPATGKEIETGDPLLSPERLKALGEELSSLLHRSTLLVDVEGPEQLRKAALRDYEASTERERAIWEAKQADRLADKMAADERITRQAEALAKHRRSNLG